MQSPAVSFTVHNIVVRHRRRFKFQVMPYEAIAVRQSRLCFTSRVRAAGSHLWWHTTANVPNVHLT